MYVKVCLVDQDEENVLELPSGRQLRYLRRPTERTGRDYLVT